MKKLLAISTIVFVCITACTNNSTKETTTTTDSTATNVGQETIDAQNKARELSDSTTMLDKKLADPNSKYSPDSLK